MGWGPRYYEHGVDEEKDEDDDVTNEKDRTNQNESDEDDEYEDGMWKHEDYEPNQD